MYEKVPFRPGYPSRTYCSVCKKIRKRLYLVTLDKYIINSDMFMVCSNEKCFNMIVLSGAK